MNHAIALCMLLFLTACCGGGSSLREGPMVEIETTEGTMTLQLDAEKAPITVGNFLSHADSGHYDGTIFHRVISEFVIQGGGWTEDFVEQAKVSAQAGNPDKPIKNEWTNGLKNLKYTIAMARESEPDSATREFYINVADNAKLDTAREKTGNAGYAVFGRVVDGFDVVERIRTGETAPRPDIKVEDGSFENVPVKPVKILDVRPARKNRKAGE